MFSHRSRGLATDGIVAGVVAAGMLVATATFVVPTFSRGETQGPVAIEDDRERLSEYQRLALEAIDLMIASAKSTLAVIDDGHLQIVLWTEDADSDGLVDAHEVLVLDHSPYLESMSACFLERPEAALSAPSSSASLPPAWHLKPSLMTHPDAMAVFLGHEDAVRHVMARTVVAARVIGGTPGASGAVSGATDDSGRIELTWNAETDDTTLTTFVPTPLPASMIGP